MKSTNEPPVTSFEERVTAYSAKMLAASRRYAGHPDLLLAEHPERRFVDHADDAVSQPKSKGAKILAMPSPRKAKRGAVVAKAGRAKGKSR